MHLAKNITMIRAFWNLGQKEFGELFEKERHHITSYEIGKAEPNALFLIRLQQYTNINISRLVLELIERSEIPNAPLLQASPIQHQEPIPAMVQEERVGYKAGGSASENVFSLLAKKLTNMEAVIEDLKTQVERDKVRIMELEGEVWKQKTKKNQ